MTAIRGAITANNNTVGDISAASVRLISELAARNNISSAVSILISSTKDITAVYPAKAIRESGIIDAPLFSCLEPDIDNALEMCIRIMVSINENIKPEHVYLEGAKILRPDLGEKKNV